MDSRFRGNDGFLTGSAASTPLFDLTQFFEVCRMHLTHSIELVRVGPRQTSQKKIRVRSRASTIQKAIQVPEARLRERFRLGACSTSTRRIVEPAW